MIRMSEEKQGVLLMENGTVKRFSEIKIGDKIRSKNDIARVDNIWKDVEIEPMIRLTVDCTELLVTKDQPVMTECGPVVACELTEGKKVLTKEHGYVPITQIVEEGCRDTVVKLDLHLEKDNQMEKHIMYISGIAMGDYIMQNNMEYIM
ncbi:Hint domain-containing protein [Anaerosporobacter faecicola]|uniref:hypothetical protein n=1 Tax=Anaerosporobacter faecicola TaxID=2718714 RepID=UPI0014390D2C|nr:hypothetical protein [Anaerosporobacter faecicola]